MLKLQCKTTFNSVFVGEKNHQNRTRVDFGIMFLTSSGTLKIERLESQIFESFMSNKTNGPKLDIQNQLYVNNRWWHVFSWCHVSGLGNNRKSVCINYNI